MRQFLHAVLLIAACAASMPALADEGAVKAPMPEATAIAVYADGLSVVREERVATLPGGPVRIDLPGLPDNLDPSSLTVTVDGSPAGTLTLRRDSLDPQSLLRRALGRQVTWITPVGDTGAEREIRGTLVNADGGVVLKVDGRYEAMPAGRLALDQLPPGMTGGLEVAAHAAPTKGTGPVIIRYVTPDLSWSADYEARLLPDASGLILSGAYSITNDTNTDFNNAALRLVAGETLRAKAAPPIAMMRAAPQGAMAMEADAAAPLTPEGATLGDVHVYDIQGRLDLPAHRTTRRVLLAAVQVPTEKTYTLTGSGMVPYNAIPAPVEGLRPTVTLSFVNAEKGPLGRALPAGPVRVFGALAADAPDAPAVILGEDRVGHLPVGATVKLALGRAFDVTASRKVTGYKVTGSAAKPWLAPYRASHEITVSNGRDEPVVVKLVETLQARKWEIRDASLAPQSTEAGRAIWMMPVPAKGQTVLTYSVDLTP